MWTPSTIHRPHAVTECSRTSCLPVAGRARLSIPRTLCPHVASQAARSNAAATHATKWSRAMTAEKTTEPPKTTSPPKTTNAPKTTNFAEEGVFKSDLFQKVAPADLLASASGAIRNAVATGPGSTMGYSSQQEPVRPWRVISSTPLAGGMLHVVSWEGPRNIRVWLPPGYSKEEGQQHPYPVLYCNDGQNVFGDCQTLSGNSWRVAQTAAELIQTGRLPPFMVVGLDHAGPLRSLEYTPYAPGTGPGGFRSDAAQWPGGGVDNYLARVQQEVVPWVAREYGASQAPADLALAGSSFGGVAALCAGMSGASLEAGCAFGALLVESPSMWIANEGCLRDVIAYRGSWPQRVYVGMGGKEHSGVRGGRGREHDAHFPRYLKAIYAALTEQGLGPDRLAWTYDQAASHTESAWAERLPEALAFVGQGWWASWARKQGKAGRNLCTSPGQLFAGTEGQLLFFNRMASSLAHLPQGTRVKVSLGHDGWQQVQKLELEPLTSGLHYQLDPPSQLQQEVFEQWGLDPELQQHLHKRLLDTVKDREAAARAAASTGEDWWVLRLPPPPPGCSRLDMAFCDGAEAVWDNNHQQDYHWDVSPAPHNNTAKNNTSLTWGAGSRGGGTVAALALSHDSASSTTVIPSAAVAAAAKTPVQSFSRRAETAQGAAATVLRMLESLRTCAIGDGCGFISPEALDRAEQHVLHGANSPAQEAAALAEAHGQLTFLMPQQPVAGLPVSLYLNKSRLQDMLKHAPSMCLQVGFNNWSIGVQKVPFRPSTLIRSESADWWCCRLDVPPEANQGAYAICGVFNGAENWDNNGGSDYRLAVVSLEAAVVQAVAGACMGIDKKGAKAPARTAATATDKVAQSVGSPKLAYA